MTEKYKWSLREDSQNTCKFFLLKPAKKCYLDLLMLTQLLLELLTFTDFPGYATKIITDHKPIIIC